MRSGGKLISLRWFVSTRRPQFESPRLINCVAICYLMSSMVRRRLTCEQKNKSRTLTLCGGVGNYCKLFQAVQWPL
jgi:hypothetical protein